MKKLILFGGTGGLGQKLIPFLEKNMTLLRSVVKTLISHRLVKFKNTSMIMNLTLY